MKTKKDNKMKKIMIIAAACAALAACNKESIVDDAPSAKAFDEGQTVTLTVSVREPGTRATSSFDPTGGAVDFKWEEKDTILVTVGGKSSKFAVTRLIAGGTGAEFTGKMPAVGSTFDVQYPCTEPDITSQDYSSTEAVPHDCLKFTAKDCPLSTGAIRLAAANAVLRLNLYGTSMTISKIVVTNTSSAEATKPTYTLNISGGVTLPTAEANAQAFFIVVPAGSWNFSAEVYDNATPAASIIKLETSGAATFTNGQVLNMPVKEVKPAVSYPEAPTLKCVKIGGVTWAPVNCGYDATYYPYGKLYQWGRKYGCGYNDSPYNEILIQSTSSSESPISSSAEAESVFYKITSEPYDWLTPQDNARWNSGSESSPSKTSNDPCPTGWRVPTKTELAALFGNNSSPSLVEVGGQKGCYFNGQTSCTSSTEGAKVFLPAAGYRNYVNGFFVNRGNYLGYWSSSVSGNSACSLYFYGTSASMYDDDYRAYGYSVRCVQE